MTLSCTYNYYNLLGPNYFILRIQESQINKYTYRHFTFLCMYFFIFSTSTQTAQLLWQLFQLSLLEEDLRCPSVYYFRQQARTWVALLIFCKLKALESFLTWQDPKSDPNWWDWNSQQWGTSDSKSTTVTYHPWTPRDKTNFPYIM